MLKERLMNGNSNINHSKAESDGDEEEVKSISEWKAAAIALCFSLFVITTKAILSNREYVREALWQKSYVYLESVLPDGKKVGYYFNQVTLKTSGFWTPLICGALITAFTWAIVYLDSSEPGVHPPTPFSPRKSRYVKPSGPVLHSGYFLAIANGCLVFLLMTANNIFNSV